jgi:hypothetical protein
MPQGWEPLPGGVPRAARPQGHLGYLIGTTNTARKRSKNGRETRAAERLQFRASSSNQHRRALTTDPDGHITDVNMQMEALTGCA